jgi:peptidylprolyl isomerase
MAKAKKGDRVRVNYEGRLEDGTVFDTTYNQMDRMALEFVIGERNVMPALEDAIIGMEIGETKTITIPPEEAHGLRDEEMILRLNRKELPNYVFPQMGVLQRIPHPKKEDEWVDASITYMDDEVVIIDCNFTLAGQTLIFDLELIDIV